MNPATGMPFTPGPTHPHHHHHHHHHASPVHPVDANLPPSYLAATNPVAYARFQSRWRTISISAVLVWFIASFVTLLSLGLVAQSRSQHWIENPSDDLDSSNSGLFFGLMAGLEVFYIITLIVFLTVMRSRILRKVTAEERMHMLRGGAQPRVTDDIESGPPSYEESDAGNNHRK